MKKILLLITILLMVCYAFAENPVAITMKVKGQVQLERNGSKTELKSGMAIYNDDKIFTAGDAFAALQFIDGKAITKIFPNSELVMRAEVAGPDLKKKPFLSSGNLFANIKKGTGNFEVQTATAVASVKGTGFVTEVGQDGQTTLFVLWGIVNFAPAAGGTGQDIVQGNSATFTTDGDIIVSAFEQNRLAPEILEQLQDEPLPKKLEVEIEDQNGDKKTIIIDFE